MLEECDLPYVVRKIDITRGEQFDPAFVAVNPNAKIPAIEDDEGPLTLFESGAILIYLAEKTGRFLPPAGALRYHALQWLMFQMGGVGPMFGQTHHFLRFAPEPVPYAIDRYRKETRRLYGVLDARLATAEYLAGDYSVADIAIAPWLRGLEFYGVRDLVGWSDRPRVVAYLDRFLARPAVQRGLDIPAA